MTEAGAHTQEYPRPDALQGGSARFQPADNRPGYLTNCLPILEPARTHSGLIIAADASPRRKLAGLRPRPFLSRENIDHLRHSFPLSSSVVADRKMARSKRSGTQKVST